MKVIVLHGSPRKGMNSDTLAGEFLRGLAETGDHAVKHFYVNEMRVRPCQGCLSCASSPGHKCTLDDDMGLIYDAYRDADLIVWASPMYWGYITAQLKAVQDRMEALAWEGFDGKIFAVFLTYRHHYESAANMFRRIAPHFHIDLHIIPCRTYDPERRLDLPIEKCSVELEEAYNIGKEFGARVVQRGI